MGSFMARCLNCSKKGFFLKTGRCIMCGKEGCEDCLKEVARIVLQNRDRLEGGLGVIEASCKIFVCSH